MYKILTIFIFLIIAGCFSSEEKEIQKELGNKDIKYYSDKSVAPLEIPPDLTKPNTKNAMDISPLISDVEQEITDFSKETLKSKKVLVPPKGIKVKKHGNNRWLEINKTPEELWVLARKFLTNNGFVIEKSNQAVGIMETNFLENKPDIPNQSLGIIRSLFKKALNQVYSTGVIDKYRIRIEPTENRSVSEAHLTLISMEEVVTDKRGDDENTIWQPRKRDIGLEAEMLYKFMVFLGNTREQAKEKILASTKEEPKSSVKVVPSISGGARLVFNLNARQTWNKLQNILDILGIEIEDKDPIEGSFYINASNTKDRNLLDKLFGKKALKKTYQLVVREVNFGITEVSMHNINNIDNADFLNFSKEFLMNVAKEFEE